jgi:hypothetical protein
MNIGLFELDEPLPVLRSPHLVTILHPWVDAGSVGTLVLDLLEKHFHAAQLGRMTRPGHFFDLTRYRPSVAYRGDERIYTVPTTTLTYTSTPQGQDLLFLRLMEPHHEAEEYIDNLVDLVKLLKVTRVVRISSMWDAVPHTRPLPVTRTLRAAGSPPAQARGRRYEGPTSIMNVFYKSEQTGAEQLSVMARLPYYAQLEEDYAGTARALEVLGEFYPIPTSLVSQAKLRRQRLDLDSEVSNKQGLDALVRQLEQEYDRDQPAQEQLSPGHPEQTPTGEPEPSLSPELENFLRELGEQFGR